MPKCFICLESEIYLLPLFEPFLGDFPFFTLAAIWVEFLGGIWCSDMCKRIPRILSFFFFFGNPSSLVFLTEFMKFMDMSRSFKGDLWGKIHHEQVELCSISRDSNTV